MGLVAAFVVTPTTFVVKASAGFCSPKVMLAFVVVKKTISKDATMTDAAIVL